MHGVFETFSQQSLWQLSKLTDRCNRRKEGVQGTSSFDKSSKESNDLTCGQEGSSWN